MHNKNVWSIALLLAVFQIAVNLSVYFFSMTSANTLLVNIPQQGYGGLVAQAENNLVIVTNSSDIVDGNTSSIALLISNPGPDGTISFREAFDAANQTLGPKIIRFAPELAGATITLALGGNLLHMISGNLTIDGDVNGDGLPDVTLDGHLDQGAIAILSSHNTVSHLTFADFAWVSLMIACPSQNCSHQTFIDNRIIGNTFLAQNATGVITIGPGGLVNPLDLPLISDVTWQDTVVSGNSVFSKSHNLYVMAAVGGESHNQIINLTISGNHFSSQLESALDIGVADADSAYFGVPPPILFSEYNRIENLNISGNTIDAPNGAGINIFVANYGNSNNAISNLQIKRNIISAMWAVHITGSITGDADARGADNNVITSLEINSNIITSTHTLTGIWIMPAMGSSTTLNGTHNRIENILIANNIIEDYYATGIEILGGAGNLGTAEVFSNTVQDITILHNRITQIQNPGTGWGISLIGGNASSDSNKILGVHILDNNIGGRTGIQALGGYQVGAKNNVVWIDEVQRNTVNSSEAPIKVQNDAAGALGNQVLMPSAITINYDRGSPGSFFCVTGINFPANSTVAVVINGIPLTDTLSVDQYGALFFLLNTSQADAGFYFVTATANPGAMISFTLDPNAPLRPQDGTGPILIVPGGIAGEVLYLPLIRR